MGGTNCDNLNEVRAGLPKHNRVARNGFSLLEVMVAAVITGILAVALGSTLKHAAQHQMNARRAHRALIEANSRLEKAYGLVDDSTGLLSSSRYLDEDMNLTSDNPDLKWNFDDKDRDLVLRARDNDGIAELTISVEYGENGRAVNLTAHKYIE